MHSLGVAALSLTVVATAAQPPELESLSFLIGEWRAAGTGEPGAGIGTATFARELQGRVIVRTSFAEYSAAAGKPSTRHDDLMIMYALAGALRADYYDSEGHVIRYGVQVPTAGEAVFVSDPSDNEPRFRLSYRLESSVLKGLFEIAPPGAADAFKPYLTWQSTKAKK